MAVVTKLEYQKNNKDRVNVFLDGGFFAGVSLEVALKFGLKVGKEIDELSLKEFLFEESKQKAFQKATDLIAKFVKTEKQMEKYLLEKGFDKSVVEDTLKKLKEYGFVDDWAYVQNYINFKKNVEGARKIKQELYLKGVSRELVNRAFDEIGGECEEQKCKELAEKYVRNKEKTLKLKASLNRFLLSKGFDYADVKRVISEVLKDDGDWD